MLEHQSCKHIFPIPVAPLNPPFPFPFMEQSARRRPFMPQLQQTLFPCPLLLPFGQSTAALCPTCPGKCSHFPLPFWKDTIDILFFIPLILLKRYARCFISLFCAADHRRCSCCGKINKLQHFCSVVQPTEIGVLTQK